MLVTNDECTLYTDVQDVNNTNKSILPEYVVNNRQNLQKLWLKLHLNLLYLLIFIPTLIDNSWD